MKNIVDKSELEENDWKMKSRMNDVTLWENFFYKAALKQIEYKKYEIILYSEKKYNQGRLF